VCLEARRLGPPRFPRRRLATTIPPDPTRPRKGGREEGTAGRVRGESVPGFFQCAHNTGAGQIGQDLRDDIGSERGIIPPAEQGESGRGEEGRK